jgi:hypothetical protein
VAVRANPHAELSFKNFEVLVVGAEERFDAFVRDQDLVRDGGRRDGKLLQIRCDQYVILTCAGGGPEGGAAAASALETAAPISAPDGVYWPAPAI